MKYGNSSEERGERLCDAIEMLNNIPVWPKDGSCQTLLAFLEGELDKITESITPDGYGELFNGFVLPDEHPYNVLTA